MQRGLILIVAAALCLCSADLAAARERGAAGTSTRKAYCASGLADCMASVRSDCNAKFTDPAQLGACFSGGVAACVNSMSGCITAAITTSGTAVQPSGTTKKAP